MKRLLGNIITAERVIKNGEVCFENDKITYAGITRTFFKGETVDYGDLYISPGFVDIHVHGGGGCDFMDGTEEAFNTIASLHASHGTTSLLATTLTSPDDELFRIFKVFEKVKKSNPETVICGLHLEGPYFSISQKGAQDERYIRNPSYEHYAKILDKGRGLIKRWSIAPELENAIELGALLSKLGILPSIGHSDAEYETAVEAYENGFTHLTHFYSGMSTIVRKQGFRYPGLIESGYMIEGMNVEIIADGCHLPPSLLKYIYKAKGADKIALVTDALRGAGTDNATMMLGSLESGYEVIIEDGVAKLPDRTAFAGSIATADRLVRNMLIHAGADMVDAVKMMTATPAKIIGLENKGSIRSGYDSDFVVFDNDVNVKAVYKNGKII